MRDEIDSAAEVEVGNDKDDLPKTAANFTKSVVHGSKHYAWHQTYQLCRQLAFALSRLSVGLGKYIFCEVIRLVKVLVDFFFH